MAPVPAVMGTWDKVAREENIPVWQASGQGTLLRNCMLFGHERD